MLFVGAIEVEKNNDELSTTAKTTTKIVFNERTLQERRDIKYPEFRYRSWSFLTRKEKDAAKQLGYKENTWDDPGLAEIETKAFDELTTTEISAAQMLGFDEDQWDCYQNHYASYTWHELKVEAIQEYCTVLGWTHMTWNANNDANLVTEAKNWEEMTSNQQEAARKLCYFKETWNKIHFDDWECTKDHYDDYTWEELSEKGVDKYFSILGWNAATWNGAAKRAPVSERLDWKALNPEQHIAARKLCYHKLEWDDPPYPTFRYRKWEHLSDDEKRNAGILSYTNHTWNELGTAKIEEKAFHDLTSTEKAAATALGFKKTVWDCYINHYEGYSWDALYTQGVQAYYIVLGFSPEMWQNQEDTNIDKGKWDTLNPAQKTAAKELCYIEESWDNVPLDKWACDMGKFYTSTWHSLVDMGVQPYFVALGWEEDSWRNHRKQSSFDWEDLSKEAAAAARDLCFIKEDWKGPSEYYPIFRYNLWDTLQEDIRDAAITLQYNEYTWNNPGTAEIEEYSFERLNSKRRKAAKRLGYSEETWDCWQNHYLGYNWEKLEEEGLVRHFDSFGWNEGLWNAVGVAPEEWEKSWSDLSSNNRIAAKSLCYLKETWNKTSLLDWNCSAAHYSDYDWGRLEEEGIQSYFALLGWSEDNWGGNSAPPITNNKGWNQLNQEQRIASRQICYTKNLSNMARDKKRMDVHRISKIFLASAVSIALAFVTFRKIRSRLRRNRFDVPVEETVQV